MRADTTAESLALIRAQAQARADLLELTQQVITAEVRVFGGWYDREAITSLAARLAKLTRAAQKQTATSTDSFATRILTTLTGKRPSPVGAIPVDGLRGGVPLETVYGRLADEYRYLTATRGPDAPSALLERPGSQPLSHLTREQIIERVVARGEVQVDDNLALAFRDQWQKNMSAAPGVITGYRRVIHPELVATGSETPGPVCGLCIVASDRLYKRRELLPLHALCRCSVAPVRGEAGGEGDPGAAINGLDLNRLYEQAGSTHMKKLKNTKVTVVQNAETGPRLTITGQNHRTAADAQRDDQIPASLPAA